ncbi:MAG: hypothetical protein JW876_04035 [Candidatus Krumholzibacteriota bacterium]|nr:hypothetical protein [Candidatus Krumholzibacteriota bacterium]
MRLLPAGIAAAAIAAAILPARPAAGADSLGVRFTAIDADVHVALERGTVFSGTTPLTIRGLEEGTVYRMTVDGPGLETRIGVLGIDGGRIRAGGRRFAAMTRNAVFPGWGTAHTDHGTAAFSDFLSLAASGCALYREDREARHLENRLDVIDGAIGADPERERILEGVRWIAATDLDAQKRHRDRLLAVTVALYAHQLIDPFLLSPPPRVRPVPGKKAAAIGSSRRSVPKALFFSLLRPGRGQFYQGKKMRGFLFETVTAAAAFLALDYQVNLDFDTARYEEARRRLAAAADESDRRLIDAEASRFLDDADEAEFFRNISLGVLAGFWGLSLFDTLLPGKENGEARWAVEARQTGFAVVLRF